MKVAVAGGTGTVGRHVVAVLTERGHEPVVLSRSVGVDLVTGSGLADALRGVGAVVDVTSHQTQSAKASTVFTRTVTATLHGAELTAGVGHHVALTIVGCAEAPHGYYAGKAAQEEFVANGPVPWSVLRATQFHEFARQVHRMLSAGPVGIAPSMRSQPVAAREVAERLVEIATTEPVGRSADLAGPREERVADMVRAYARATGHRGLVLEVPLPGGFGRAVRDGTVLPGPGAQLGRQTFDEWLALETLQDKA